MNDSDPLWQRRFRDAVSHLDTAHHHETSWAASRFAERDELRYSLRSLEMHANWVNHIFIVTDQQVPSWLVEDHPRITVIDHSEIFDDPDSLPVFNSHAIESRLHHIPGLAERYLYLNDDVFFGSPVIPDQFFTSNGIAKFFLSDRPIGLDPVDDRDLPVSAAAKNNRTIIERLFGVTVTQKFQHTPHPQLRTVLEEMEQRLPEEFAAVARSQFRSPQDISVAAALHHYYAYATGRAVPGTLNYQFLELSEPDTVMELRKLALRRHLEVFCLNDTMSTGAALDRQRDVIREFCEQYYPVPSSFEKP